MKPLQIEEPGATTAPGTALLALGFRPFFLLAGLAAIVLMGLWLKGYAGELDLPQLYGPASRWHAHEMLFGYTVAVIAGFLLTAVRNWTEVQTLRGPALGALALVWLAGRVLPFFPALPLWLVSGLDLLFLPLLTVAVARPLWRVKQVKNYAFVGILALLFIANLLMHLAAWGGDPDAGRNGELLALYTILLLIVIMGGRVIPFFIERGVPGQFESRSWPVVEIAGSGLIVLLAGLELLQAPGGWRAGVAGLAAVVHGIRLAGWLNGRLFRVPLLWVLAIGYGWLVIGFALLALTAMDPGQSLLALHALTAGGIGMLTLGMMARVALGHTGRPLQVRPVVALAFGLLLLAAVVRVLLPLLWPESYASLIRLSGSLWIIAFALFVYVYLPILIRPRVDGRPG